MWTSLPGRSRGIPAWPPKVGSPEQAVEDRVPEADWRVSPAQLVTAHRRTGALGFPGRAPQGVTGAGVGPRLCTKLGPPRLPLAFRIFFQLKVPRVKTAHGVFRAPFTHSARERVWRTGRQRGAGRASATFTRGPGRKPEGQGFGSDSVGATRGSTRRIR